MKKAVVRVFSEQDYQSTAWAGGKTTQLAIFPEDGDYAGRIFQWRLSSATVEAAHSKFTVLPGVRRYLMPLRGSVELVHAGGAPRRLQPFRQDEFDGGLETESDGQCSDFNLMTQGGCEGALSQFLCGLVPAGIALAPDISRAVDEAFFAADGDVTALFDGREFRIPHGSLLLIRFAAGAGAARAVFTSAQPVHVVRATMREALPEIEEGCD